MEIVFIFLVAGVGAAFLLFLIDDKQYHRLNGIIRETKNVQPLFLLKSTEQKLNTLNTLLYGDLIVNGNNTTLKGRLKINEGARQILSAELSRMVSDHKCGRITLKEYHKQLNELLATVNKVKNLNFDQIK